MLNALKYIGILILLFGLFNFLSGTIMPIFQDEITEYPVLCHNDIPTTYDCVDATPLNRTTYKIYKKDQSVAAWMPDFEYATLIDHYTNCLVLDRKNWTCKYDDTSGKFGFNDGNFVQSPRYSDYIYVSENQWLKADSKIDSLE